MENEVWKDIPWYDWKYQASNLWKIRSTRHRSVNRYKILKWKINRDWYINHWLVDIKTKTFLWHRLVIYAFKWVSDLQVNHINWIKTDNSISNLEYCTGSENATHKINILKCDMSKQIEWMFLSRRKIISTSCWLEFASVREAERVTGISRATIKKMARLWYEHKWYMFNNY